MKGIADGDQTVRQNPGAGKDDVKDDHESTKASVFVVDGPDQAGRH